MHKNIKLFAYAGIALILATVGLLFVPAFANLFGYTHLSGYNFIFGYLEKGGINYLAKNALGQDDGKVSAAGIITLICLFFSLVSLVFHKKSSVLSLLGGLFLAIAGILLLCTPLWATVIYNGKVTAYWLAYVLGGVLLVYGGFVVYLAIMILRDEKNELSKPKSQQYSYLKK